jgi:cell division protein FtsA
VSKKERIVCGLDIGTTKICMLIARAGSDGDIEVISTGYANSSGLKKGIVIDLDEAAASIRKAADEAELKAGISVDWVTVGVSGNHIQSYNCHGAIPVEGRHHEVTLQDMQQVIRAAQSIPIPPDREIIHVLPQEFLLDNRGDIQNPVGLTGSRLDVNIHVVTCESALNQNLINAVNRAQMRVVKVVLQQLASAESVLSRDEKELGVAVVDIGGGTTDIAVFVNNGIRFSGVLPVGGAHFTRDLAIGLRTPLEDAERLKRDFGSVLTAGIAADEVLEVPGVGAREPRLMPRRMACEILHDRAAELLELIRDQLARSGSGHQLIAGVVLTGGGSMLDGILELAEQVFDLPVRQGLPREMPGLTDELSHPVYATALGLAIMGAQTGDKNGSHPWKPAPPWMLSKILSWISST